MCDLEDVKSEAEALLLTKDSTVGGRNFQARAAVVIGACMLLASGGGVAWWRTQRLSVEGVIGESGCSQNGEDCRATQCCANAGSSCFRKNDHWASCNATCSSNYKWEGHKWVNKGHEHVWDCHPLSCSDDGQNCMSSRCCSKEGSKCFKKNEHWASCNASCSHNYKWEHHAWKDMGEKVWDCEELVPHDGGSSSGGDDSGDSESECDTSGCNGCSGEQCQYCREGKERDCCLDEACSGAQGEQVAQCRSDHLDECCEGKTGHCKSGSDGGGSSGGDNSGDGDSECDTSGCHGCSGEQCQYCREGKERDCCLDEACSGAQDEQVAQCRSDHLDECCEGKTGHCKSD